MSSVEAICHPNKVTKNRKQEGTSGLPTHLRNTTVPCWIDYFKVYINEAFGCSCAIFCYLIRQNDAVPAMCPLTGLAVNHSTIGIGKFIETDNMALLSHTHPL